MAGERWQVTDGGSARRYDGCAPRLGPVLGDWVTPIRAEFHLHQEILSVWSWKATVKILRFLYASV